MPASDLNFVALCYVLIYHLLGVWDELISILDVLIFLDIKDIFDHKDHLLDAHVNFYLYFSKYDILFT